MLSASQHDPMDPSSAASQQHHHNLTMHWLEQQQLEHQNRHSLNQAIFAATQQQQQQQNTSRPTRFQHLNPSFADDSRNTLLESGSTSNNSMNSSISSAQLQHEYLLNAERQRQTMRLQQQSQQVHLQMQMENNSMLQQNLGRLFSEGRTNPDNSANSTNSIAAAGTTVGDAELDQLMAAESLLRRGLLQETVQMLQMQGVSMVDAQNRRRNSIASLNEAAGANFLAPNGPILPQLFQTSVTNSFPNGSQPSHSGILNGTFDGNPRVSLLSAKRLSEEQEIRASKKPKNQNGATYMSKHASFPLPSRKQARRISIKFTSFQTSWDKLENTTFRKEIFRRRLYKSFKR
jgi:hypothetical protein